MESVVAKGLILGLSTGAYCLGACVPAALPYLVAQGEPLRASGRAVAQLAAGRLAAYLVVGALAGALGTHVQASLVARAFAAAAMVGLGGLMLGYGLSRNFHQTPFCRRIGQWPAVQQFPFAAGLLMGVNLCPPILLCITTILGLHSVASGLLMALGFFAGSLVFLLPLVFAGFLGRCETLKGIALVATLFCGVWFVTQGIAALMGLTQGPGA